MIRHRQALRLRDQDDRRDAGVVCIDTTKATTEADPFCGFTALTPVGEGPIGPGGWGGLSAPMLIGTHWYAFNYVTAVNVSGAENELLCFDMSTDAACNGQPFAVSFGAGTVELGAPSPATAAIGSQVIIPIRAGGSEELACFDDGTQSNCAGSWPASLGFSYVGEHGSPFPLLDSTGKIIGLCLSTGTDQCFTLAGASTPTPAGMTAIMGSSDAWNGPALVLGPRVYVPSGEGSQSGEVECFDYSTGAGCANFPKTFTELDYLYSVNADPQRPTCIWVNSNDGGHQIQDFDAYTGEACGQGTVRVLASQFVAPAPQCMPANYVSVQVLQPPRSSYSSGSVAFADGDGNLISGLSEITLDESGSASLNGLGLNTATGLPQFLFTLQDPTGPVGSVEVKLTWEGNYDESCAGEGRTVVKPPTPAPAAKAAPATAAVTPVAAAPKPVGGVLPFGAAHIARRNTSACIASAGYLAAVSGKAIASVTFTLDGHKVATVSKPGSHGTFATRVRVPAGARHKLTMHVTFTAASHTAAKNIRRTLARCAVAHPRPTPRFTG